MKILLFAFLAIYAFVGCQDIILEDENSATDNNITIHNGALPVVKSPVDSYVDLSEYLYPENLAVDKTLYFDSIYLYSQTSSSAFTNAPDIYSRSYAKTINSDTTRVTEYKDELEQKYDDIKQYKIISYEKSKIAKEYPVRVAKNSKVLDIIEDRVQTICVVVYIGARDLTPILPLYVKNDLKNRVKTIDNNFKPEQFNFDNILHIYCGTSDNHTTDSYYSKKYGKVLEIKKDIEKDLLKVEVVDVLR